jgi:hypothetical protein
MIKFANIKPLLSFFAFTLAIPSSWAQERSSFFSLSLGPSFPAGNYASKDYDNYEAGWAQPGVSFDLLFNHKIGKGDFGVSLLSRGQVHMMDGQAFVNELDAKMPDTYWSIDGGVWSLSSLMFGGFGSIPVTKSTTFDPRIMVGFTGARLPDYTVLGAVNGSRFWVKQVSTTAVAFSYMLGAGFKFNLGKKYALLTQLDYLGGAPEFSQVEILTSSGDRSFDTWKQGTSTVNVMLGLGVRF